MNLTEFISTQREKAEHMKKNITPANRKLIETNLRRLETIERQLAITSYRLVFIGEPGSGKTTTICHYLNLIKEIEIGSKFDKIELFDTASGRTTAFEVHYLSADHTGFEIFPMEISKQLALVQDYCEYIWQLTFENIDGDDDISQSQDTSTEYDRIIRNMLGFSSPKEFKEYVSSQYRENQRQIFLIDMLKKSAINDRNCTVLSYPEGENVKNWLKTTFNAINYGKHPDVSIPERVNILLNPNELKYDMPDFVSEVIDTRGYDGNAREDLRAYLEKEDTISVILDKVEDLPGVRQSKILSEWLDSVSSDVVNRISLMVKIKNDALSKVNEADGNPEKGEELKREELERAVISRKLHYDVQNTLFVDSYEGILCKARYKVVGGKKQRTEVIDEFDEEIRQFEQQRMTDHFSQMIQRHKEKLSAEAEKIQQQTEQLFHAISSDRLAHVKTSLLTLKDILERNIRSFFPECEGDFCSYFRCTVHWKSAQKTISMNGEWWKADIYFEYMDYCERKVNFYILPIKQQMHDYINNLKSEDVSDEMNALVESCKRRIDFEYRQLIEKGKKKAGDLCHGALTPDFWQEKASYVDRGSGYYDRLMSTIEKQMLRTDLCGDTSAEFLKLVDTFFENVVSVLEN